MIDGPTSAGNPRATTLGVVLLTIVVVVAYANSFSVPLILDDWVTILNNPSIRRFTSIRELLSPPEATGVGGRPVAHLSFVVNYAVSGDSLHGYHVVNLLIHLSAALVLFGIVRRTLSCPRFRVHFGAAVDWCALAVAMLWALHPVQTQSVTYVSQRTEALMGLFYLSALYAFIRGAKNDNWAWRAAAVLFCFCGIGTKEGMVTAPVVLFLYDVLFVAGSWRSAWRSRRWFYVSAACSWIVLAFLMRGLGSRGVGFGHGMAAWSYLFIECRAVIRYASLAIWPANLVFDYGTDLGAPTWRDMLSAVGLMVGATAVSIGFWRKSAVAFLGIWFFVTLAPTSSVVPIPLQPISENRVYLPLAGFAVGAVIGIHHWLGERGIVALIGTILGFGLLTSARNTAYRTEVSIWADTAAKQPGSSRAHNNLGQSLLAERQLARARAEFETALRLRPDYADAHANLASVLGQLGEVDAAIAHSYRATQIDPHHASGFYNLGVALSQKGDVATAIAAYEACVRIQPESVAGHSNLAILLLQQGRVEEAIRHCQAALRVEPAYFDAEFTLGCAWAMSGKPNEAVQSYEKALRARPNHVDTLTNLGASLHQLGRLQQAVDAYQAALRAAPNNLQANLGLGGILLTVGRNEESLQYFEAVVKDAPNLANARLQLGIALARLGRDDQARVQLEAAQKLDPSSTTVREALVELGRRAPKEK